MTNMLDITKESTFPGALTRLAFQKAHKTLANKVLCEMPGYHVSVVLYFIYHFPFLPPCRPKS